MVPFHLIHINRSRKREELNIFPSYSSVIMLCRQVSDIFLLSLFTLNLSEEFALAASRKLCELKCFRRVCCVETFQE